MKTIWREILLAVLMGMLLPGIVVDLGVRCSVTEKTAREEPTTAATQILSQAEALQIRFREGDEVTQMDADSYLVGVLLAELPAGFHPEAFKAQAVVARTYAMKAYTTGGKHSDGSVCGDSACCQAYIPAEEYLNRGGLQQTVKTATDAVTATSGQVLTYEGALIEATYFSCSGGSTEDAIAVWGTDFPYLRATDSPGEEYASHYSDTVSFSLEEFSQKLGIALSGSDWLGAATYTAGDGVNTIYIGGKEMKGTQIRSLLGLRSTNFQIVPQGKTVSVHTKGYGHRVGMSQYGADSMATAGSTYEQILAHYYRGTQLTLWEN